LLRDSGVKTRIDLGRSSEDAQRRRARRLGVPVLAFIGKAEVESGTVTLYNTISGERVTVRLEDVGGMARRMLRGS